MLVKIIAIGLEPGAWREVFRALRGRNSGLPFSVGIFSTAEELAFLDAEFFPRQWRRESPDFLFCGAPEESGWAGRLEMLNKVYKLPGIAPPVGVLVVEHLERSLRAMLGQEEALGLLTEGGGRFLLRDPAFLLRSFPRAFPRIPLDAHLQGLRLKEGTGAAREVIPEKLEPGTLVGFSEIETVITTEGPAKPRDWLKALASATGRKSVPRAAGLIREEEGIFLFPGIPLERVRGVELAGLPFTHVIEQRLLDENSPQFFALAQAIENSGQAAARRLKEQTALIRLAEARTDIPLVCGGENALLRESLAALLTRGGYPRCYTLDAPGEGIFREPSLLLQVTPWAKGKLGPQADAPMTLDLTAEMERRMTPLNSLLPWKELPFEPPPPDLAKLSGEAFAQQSKRLRGRGRRVSKALELEEKRHPLLQQETGVLEAAMAKLAELLGGAGDAIQVWSGAFPASAKQALIFSHDQEEAGAVLQAIPHIQKKRWFDLSPFDNPDAIMNLRLDDVRHYATEGVMLITRSSRERLEKSRGGTAAELETASAALAENKEALARLGSEAAEVAEARERLARQFVWQALADWLAENAGQLDRALQKLRDKHERRWFNRARVRRVLIVPYIRENGDPLLKSCAQVYPSFSKDLSVVVPYEYDLQDVLPEDEERKVRQEAKTERLSPRALNDRLSKELARRNEGLFAEFLQVVSGELTGMRMDLVLVEHHPDFAGRILEHLRRAVPSLENTPAILMLSGFWEPPPQKPLPWPRTRVVLLPRMGTLSAEDGAGRIRSLYSV